MTSGKKDNVFIVGERKPGTQIPVVDRTFLEKAKKEYERLCKGEKKDV